MNVTVTDTKEAMIKTYDPATVEAVRLILHEADGIPGYAIGDSEAACTMSDIINRALDAINAPAPVDDRVGRLTTENTRLRLALGDLNRAASDQQVLSCLSKWVDAYPHEVRESVLIRLRDALLATDAVLREIPDA